MEFEISKITPKNWPIKAIADVCQCVTSGGTPSRKNPAFFQGGSWPWVKTQELTDCWIEDTEEQITDAAVNASSAKVLPANTVLMAAYSTETDHPVHGKVDSRSVATRGVVVLL